MFIIIDSGSTKSDWVLIDPEHGKTSISTRGFNPFFHSAEDIASEIRKHEEIMRCAEQVETVYFYGAGCSSPELREIVAIAFRQIFIRAAVSIDHDLKACAYATYDGKPGISCILGTGSNSCFFDGEELYQEVPALGYILGDEGSGSYFGKQLASAYLYKQLPDHLSRDFEQDYGLTKTMLLEKVYKQPNANVYLASLSKFISKHAHEEVFKTMVYEGLKKFITIHVCCFSNYKEVKTHFIGSIALVFQKELELACEELGVQIGQIIQKPIEGLLKYHLTV